MKQRITYLLPQGNRVDPADIKVDNDSLGFGRAHEAAEEWRLTLGLDDLPDEIQPILRDCHELHVRWTSSRNEGLVSPLVSRLPAGLHAFFTPRDAAEDVPICDLLRKLLGPEDVECHSVSDTFSKPPILSERFSASSTYQYYHLSTLRENFGNIFLQRLCDTKPSNLDTCETQLRELHAASYVDIDYDAISHTVLFTAFWSAHHSTSLAGQRAQRPVRKLKAEDRIEVGVLQPEQATEPEELSLGGYLAVIGQDDHPSMTLFSFPSRHHPLPTSSHASYSASFQQPTGLHPKFEITLPTQHLAPPKNSCSLHAYWTLPFALFVDRYQLSDSLFLASQNLVALHSLGGEQDLEAPEWVIKRWGSAALLQLATPQPQKPGTTPPPKDWTITIPTHLRYLDGRKHDSSNPEKASVNVPWPVLFWACEAEEGLKMATNPFDRVNLGYDGLFGPKTMFYHIPPDPNVKTTTSEVKVPVLNAESAAWVQIGTLVAVAAGFAWVCWQLLWFANKDVMLGQKKQKER